MPPDQILRRAGLISLLVLSVLLALSPLLAASGIGASPALLIAGLLLGLPHGGIDHLVPARLSARARPLPARVALLLLYAAAAGLGLLAFHAAPDLALIGFLTLAVVHFGAADEAFHAERDGRPIRPRAIAVLAYGGPPVILPLALWRDQVDPLLAAVAPAVPALLTGEIRVCAAVTLLGAIVITAIRDGRAPRSHDSLEPLLLAALFSTVPPPLAIGAYFGVWHSGRHIARLLRSDPDNTVALNAGQLGPPLIRFTRQAAVPTTIAGALLIALITWPGHQADPLPAVVAVLAALTLPHAALVTWMDRQNTPDPTSLP